MQDIYEIKDEYLALQATLNEMLEDGHIDQECIDNTMADIAGSLEGKCINLSKMIKNKEAYIVGLEQRADEINKRLRQFKNKIKNSKSYNDYLTKILHDMMRTLDKDRIETNDFVIKEVGKRAAVITTDCEAIPNEYLKVETVTKVDKDLAYEHLKKGMAIPGLRLGEDKRIDIK